MSITAPLSTKTREFLDSVSQSSPEEMLIKLTSKEGFRTIQSTKECSWGNKCTKIDDLWHKLKFYHGERYQFSETMLLAYQIAIAQKYGYRGRKNAKLIETGSKQVVQLSRHGDDLTKLIGIANRGLQIQKVEKTEPQTEYPFSLANRPLKFA